jgi:hypothetical protein
MLVLRLSRQVLLAPAAIRDVPQLARLRDGLTAVEPHHPSPATSHRSVEAVREQQHLRASRNNATGAISVAGPDE